MPTTSTAKQLPGKGYCVSVSLETRRTVTVMPSTSCGKISDVDIGRQEVHTLGIGTGNACTSRIIPGPNIP